MLQALDGLLPAAQRQLQECPEYLQESASGNMTPHTMPAQRAHLEYLADLLDDDEEDYADQVSCLEAMHLL